MKILRIFVVVFAVAISFVMKASAIDIQELGLETDIKFVSAHVWRGMILNEEPCIQPSVIATTGDASINVWGTWDLTSVSNASARTRMDVALDYTLQSGRHMFIPGLTSYIYHDASYSRQKDTFEVSLDYVLDVLLLPSISINYDFGQIDGFYFTAGVAHSFDLIENKWFLDLKADVGAGDSKYVDYNFHSDSSNLEELSASLIDMEASVAFPYLINEWCTVTPGVRYMTIVGADVKDAVELDGEDTDQFIYSINCSLFF